MNSNKSVSLIASSLLVGLLSTSAVAQSKFDGAYVQGGVGYQNLSTNMSNGSIVSTAGTPPAGTYGISSTSNFSNDLSGAVGLGYGFTVSPKVNVAVGIDYNVTDTKYSTKSLIGTQYTSSSTGKAKNQLSYYVAPGYVLSNDSLAYAKLGYTTANVQSTSGSVTDSENIHGYSVGAGYKQFLNENIYLFGEASYLKFQNKHYSGAGTSYTGTYNYDSKTDGYNFLVGVGYKF